VSDKAKRPPIARDPTIPRFIRITALASYVAMLVCGLIAFFVSDHVHGRVVVSRSWAGLTAACMAVFLVALITALAFRVAQNARRRTDG
jgi:hypothetical protein